NRIHTMHPPSNHASIITQQILSNHFDQNTPIPRSTVRKSEEDGKKNNERKKKKKPESGGRGRV
ncbi:hypothetical protein, partial [Salmonella enterica]|uniref:hypothetical protein n=1 Tax=Salmonella enterica TaxID=28901 RepID=UPI001F437C1D